MNHLVDFAQMTGGLFGENWPNSIMEFGEIHPNVIVQFRGISPNSKFWSFGNLPNDHFIWHETTKFYIFVIWHFTKCSWNSESFHSISNWEHHTLPPMSVMFLLAQTIGWICSNFTWTFGMFLPNERNCCHKKETQKMDTQKQWIILFFFLICLFTTFDFGWNKRNCVCLWIKLSFFPCIGRDTKHEIVILISHHGQSKVRMSTFISSSRFFLLTFALEFPNHNFVMWVSSKILVLFVDSSSSSVKSNSKTCQLHCSFNVIPLLNFFKYLLWKKLMKLSVVMTWEAKAKLHWHSPKNTIEIPMSFEKKWNEMCQFQSKKGKQEQDLFHSPGIVQCHFGCWILFENHWHCSSNQETN